MISRAKISLRKVLWCQLKGERCWKSEISRSRWAQPLRVCTNERRFPTHNIILPRVLFEPTYPGLILILQGETQRIL
jgi:hypothetical protein